VNLIVDPHFQEDIVERAGIAFFFAPAYHPAMKHVMAARQEIGCRTVFNVLARFQIRQEPGLRYWESITLI